MLSCENYTTVSWASTHAFLSRPENANTGENAEKKGKNPPEYYLVEARAYYRTASGIKAGGKIGKIHREQSPVGKCRGKFPRISAHIRAFICSAFTCVYESTSCDVLQFQIRYFFYGFDAKLWFIYKIYIFNRVINLIKVKRNSDINLIIKLMKLL